MDLIIKWGECKNSILKKERKISFEDVETAIINKKIIDIIPHHNQRRYSDQKLMIIEIKNYIYYVPFTKNKNEIFLKTIIPSRKYQKIFKEKI